MKIALLFGFAFFSLSLGSVNQVTSPVTINTPSGTVIQSMELPSDEPLSPDYEVWIDGIKAVIYTAKVQDPPWDKTLLNHGGTYSFVSFDISKPVEIKIHSVIVGNGYRKNFINTVIRPDNAKIKNFINKNNEISFTIDKPVKLSIEPDGKNGPLLIFANPVINYKPVEGDKNVIYYGPGIHKPDSALIRVRDNQTLYLAEGAIVKAGVIVSGNNATICGRGILCGNDFIWGKRPPNMVLIRGNNVVVKDIIIRGAATWTIPIRSCHNVVIDNVKILGGRAQNDDGIDPVNAQDVLIKDCFIRSDDDCIAMKGMQDPPNNKSVERITIENTILWCDKAKTILLGHESRAEYMRDITFKNIDIIHMGHHAFVLEPGEEMKLENILFENIRINGNGQIDLISIRPLVNQYMRTKVPGYASNITFENVTVTGIAGKYRIWLAGADEKHNVSGVTMSNISISGEKIKTGSKYLQVDNFVNNLIIK
jgi:hypothetical protein